MQLIFAIFCLFIILGPASAQDTLGAGFFAPRTSSLLLFNFEDQSHITGALHSVEPAQKDFSFVEIPVNFSDLSLSDAHVSLMLKPVETLVVGYNRQPSVESSTLIARFRALPSEQQNDLNDAFQFSPPSPGLYMFRNGLRTRIYYSSSPASDLRFEGMPPVHVASPDAVGFVLPDGSEGRTIGKTGQMFVPTPLMRAPIVSFGVDPMGSNEFILDFSRPEPGWFKDVTDLVLKLIAVLLPIPLLIFSKPEDVNQRRYKLVAGLVVLCILAAYGGLSYYAYAQGLGFKKIGENAFFAFATIVVTFLTYWTTRSTGQPPQ